MYPKRPESNAPQHLMSPVWNSAHTCSSPAITWAAPAEIVQSLSQPSLSTMLASSHSSGASTSPLPHSKTTHSSLMQVKPSAHAPSSHTQFSSPGSQSGPVVELSPPLLVLPPSLLELMPPLPAVVPSAVVSSGVVAVPVVVPVLEPSVLSPAEPMPPLLGVQAASAKQARNRVLELSIVVEDTKARRWTHRR
jgi:hypothetical protein